MKSRLVRISWTVGILFVCFSLISVSLAQGLEAEPPAGEMPIVEETAAASDWPAPELTVGIETRSSETEGIGDVLIPLWYPDGKGLLFINPRLSFNDHDYEEYNIGLGYRQFIDRFNLILGANAYYDYRNTDRDNYGQWGVGLELLSTWIDARANYYHPDSKKVLFDSQTASASSTSTRVGPSWNDPYATGHTIVQDYTIDRTVSTLTTTRTYEQFQQALGGYDWEIGVRLPLPIEPEKLEARVFGGYYDFDNDIGTTAHGWKTRAELRLYTTVSLYAGLNRNSDLTGSDWFAGALFTVPLNPDAAQSRWNADPRVLTDRLTDMVVRDRQVRLGTSEFIENPSLEEKTITRSKKTLESGSLTVMDDVQFVNGDVGTSGDGTGERPFASIQEGADGVFGLRNVYVFHASGPYNENVVLQQDTALWGSGSLIPAFGGRSFGSGVAPIVDGMSMGPTITMADRSTVSGFHIRNSNKNLPPIFYNAPWPPPNPGSIDISRAGIFGDDVTGLAVYDNVIARNSYGALFVRLGDFDLDFARNDVRNNAEHGLWIEGHGNSGSFNVLIRDSNVSDNRGSGLFVNSDTYDFSGVFLENSMFNRNDDSGIYVIQNNTANTALFVADGLVASDNIDNGLFVNQDNNANAFATMSDITALANDDKGVYVNQENSTLAVVDLSGITANANDDEGVYIYQYDNATAVAILSGITANANDDEGVDIYQSDNGLAIAFLTDISANNNGDEGVDISQEDNVTAVAVLSRITANANDDEGVYIYQYGNDNALADLTDVFADANGDQGIDVNQDNNTTAWANLTGIIANNNSDENVYVSQESNDSAEANLTDIVANHSADDEGVRIYQYDNIAGRADLMGIIAHDNRRDGVAIEQINIDEAHANLSNITANHNRDSGVRVEIGGAGGSPARVLMERITTRDNDADGMTLIDNYSGKIVFRGQQLVSANNTDNGVNILSDGFGALVLDFGGGLSSIGQSSFYDNGNVGLFYNNGKLSTTVDAENNWWGANADPVANGQTAGNVDAAPWLAVDPNL